MAKLDDCWLRFGASSHYEQGAPPVLRESLETLEQNAVTLVYLALVAEKKKASSRALGLRARHSVQAKVHTSATVTRPSLDAEPTLLRIAHISRDVPQTVGRHATIHTCASGWVARDSYVKRSINAIVTQDPCNRVGVRGER